MAVGSNSLGLMFKIGVDTGDAQKQLQEMVNSLSASQRALVSKELAGSLSALNEELKKNKNLTDEQKIAIQAAIEVVQRYKNAIDDTSKAAKEHQVATRQVATGLNEVKSAFQSVVQGNFASAIGDIFRAMRTLGPEIAAVIAVVVALGAAIYGTKKFFDGLIDAADKIGTDSRDDFDELRKSLERVNFQLTLADHALSQEINKSLKDISSEVTKIFAILLRDSGPALILLLKEVNKTLEASIPLAQKFNSILTANIIQLAALIKTVREFEGDQAPKLVPGAALGLNAVAFGRAWFDNIQLIKKQAEELGKTLSTQTGTFKPKDTKEDLTQAQLAENEAARELALQREKAAAAEAEVNRQLKAGAISVEEALGRRLAILQTLRFYEDAYLDAQRTRIEADVKGERRKTDALEENANARKILDEKEAADQAAVAAKSEEEYKQFVDERLKQLDKIIESEKDLDAIIRERAKVAPPGAPLAVEGQVPAIEPEIKLPKPVGGFFDDLQKSLESSISTFTTWGDLVGKILGQFAQATEQAFAAFILTGKLSGQIFKQLVAQIIASLAIESTVKAVFEFAEAAAAYAVGDIPGGIKHTAAGELYATVAVIAGAAGLAIGAAGGLGGGSKAAAGAGGFGGTQEAPGTVTINQGSPGTLGIQLLSSINGHLSNLSTASPGDVVTRGSEQNPVAIGQANNEASRRDGSISREFLQISGLRTA